MSTINVNQIVDSQGGVLAPISSVMRNRIINGNMTISQRNGTSSVTPTDGQYTLDRWRSGLTQTGKYSVQQDAGAITPPAGFTDYLGVTSLSSYSVTSTDLFWVGQLVEGFNFADMNWGTANASTVTLSFWVRSSLTGTFGGAVLNSAANRSYPYSYTINAANTWEQKTITIAGDTTGTWIGATNGIALWLEFSLGTGSAYQGTAGSWSGSFLAAPTGQTSVVGTNGATFYITGVQLEKGTQATGFEYRQYGTELALCQRYYQSINFSEAQGVYTKFGSGVAISTTQARTNTFLLVKMRTYPSLVVTSTATNYGVTVTSDIACSAVPTINVNSNPSVATMELTVASGLTAGNAVLAQANNNQTAYVGFNAEL